MKEKHEKQYGDFFPSTERDELAAQIKALKIELEAAKAARNRIAMEMRQDFFIKIGDLIKEKEVLENELSQFEEQKRQDNLEIQSLWRRIDMLENLSK